MSAGANSQSGPMGAAATDSAAHRGMFRVAAGDSGEGRVHRIALPALCRLAANRNCAALLAATALTAITSPVAAQDDDGLYWAQRKRAITVTATRFPTDISDVPGTVSVITDEQIADEMATDIKDLIRFEPGISVRRAPSRFGAALGVTGRAGNEGFTIRGIGGNRVLVQVDGIRSPQGFEFGAQDAGRGSYTDVGLVKRVEILRGPGSALYGSDGLAGVVSFITSDPSDLIEQGSDVGGFVRAQYNSSDNEFSESAAIAGQAGDFSAMLAYTRRDFNELENKGTVGGIGETRTMANPQDGRSDGLLGKLVWANDGHRLRLTGEYLQRKLHTDVLTGQGPAYLFGPTPSWIVDDLQADDETERRRLSLDWTWEGEGAIEYAQLAAYWQDGRDIQFTDEDRSPVNATPRPDRERLNTFDNRVWGLAAEARSTFSTGAIGHRLNFGGDISWTNQKGVRDGVEPPSGEQFPTSAFPETDYSLGGIFLGDEITLFDGGLSLFPALRFDFYSLDPQADPLYPDNNLGSQKESRLSPKMGAVAKLGGKVRMFVNYAQGFRAPTPFQINNFFSNPAFGYTSEPNPDLGPERSESWEAGIRYVGENFSISGTAFTGDYSDFIAQADVGGSGTPQDPTVFKYINIGRVQIEGLEAKADFALDNGITGRFAIAYAKGNEILPGGAKVPLETIDPLNLVAGLGYRDPGGRFGGDVILTHNARKQADSTTAGNFRPDASTILDATAFIRVTDALTLRAGVFNITDEKYWLWSDVRGLSATSQVADAYSRPGRNASASVSFRF